MQLNIQNETARLKSVILGIADDMGSPLDINPVSKSHIENGTYPTQSAIQAELLTVEEALKSQGIDVYRPENISGTDQIFTRDIGFVIDQTFVIANMKEEVRMKELPGIQSILDSVPSASIMHLPDEATIEGGDVIVHNDHILIGISKRTNWEGFEFIKQSFPNKKVHALPLVVTDQPNTNILHLDCAFQPVGKNSAIIYEAGFQTNPQIIYDLFQPEALIHVTQNQKELMFPNIFSLAPDLVLIEENFTELIEALDKKGIRSIKVKYQETSKLSGLLRCSTLPLYRYPANT